MKNKSGLCPIVLDIPQHERFIITLPSIFKSTIKLLALAFVSLLVFNESGFAQSSGANLNTIYNNNPQESRDLKKAIKAEEASSRAAENISTQTMVKFKSNFPGATQVAWSVPGEQFVEVQFHNKKDKAQMAFYSFDNKLLGTGHYASYDNIPARAQKYIERKYASYTPGKVMWIDLNEDADEALDLFESPIANDGYFIEMKNGDKRIVLQVETDGEVSFFSNMR